MISEYIGLFGWKWFALMCMFTLMFLFFLFRIKTQYNTMFSKEKIFQTISIGISLFALVLIFLFSILMFSIYGQEMFHHKWITVSVLMSINILLIGSGLFDILFRKKLNNINFTDAGVQLLIYGILFFIAFMFFYSKWLI